MRQAPMAWGVQPDPQRRQVYGFPPRPVFSKSNAPEQAEELSPEDLNKDVKKPGTSAWDILAKASLAGMVAVNIPLLFSPIITKKAQEALTRRAANAAKQEGRGFSDKLLKRMADFDGFKASLVSLSNFATLLQLNTGYQIGINTQQPSKTLASISGTFSTLATIFKPVPFAQSWAYLSAFLWFAGETNDIKNNNNPGQRRDHDQKKLINAVFGKSDESDRGFFKELKETAKFIGGDCRYVLSYKPWQDLISSIRNKEDWKKPHPYQTAIGSQLSFIGFLGATAAFLTQVRTKRIHPGLKNIKYKDWPNKFKRLPDRLSKFTQYVMACSVVSYMPVLMRALQNKDEKDSALTFVGVPLVTANQVVKGALDLKNWQGLFALGGPIVNEGKRENSKKYRAQVSYLTHLRNLAIQNPNLKASDVLTSLQSQPEQLKVMAESMGQFRVKYILNLLQEGAQKQQFQPISLADYLQPLIKMGA